MKDRTSFDRREDVAAESGLKSEDKSLSKTRKRNSDEEFHGGYGRTDKGLWRQWNAGYADKRAECGS